MLNQIRDKAQNLARIDAQGAQEGARISELLTVYRQRFDAVAEAWRIKGLDHNSGLQGAFRETVHRLQARAGQFNTSGLYLQLLQIRRAEKDLGLRREAQYSDKVMVLVGAFEARVMASRLDSELKQRLLQEATSYRQAFTVYAEAVLAEQDNQGGKGPFRQAAHRIEALIDGHYVPDLGYNVLQLRRREKDYLLRGDRQYVDMALQELARIHIQLENSAIADADKTALQGLLNDYQRDFLALVEQNQLIERLHKEMRGAVAQLGLLLQGSVREAEQAMRSTTERIHASSAADAQYMQWVAALATLLGVLSAVIIILSIARPLRRMAGLLDQVAYAEPIERIPTVPGGRDEVNAMAQSVNSMADHKANFLDWWKASMRETLANEQAVKQPDSAEAQEEWEQARRAKQELLNQLQGKIRRLLLSISAHGKRLEQGHPHGQRLQDTLDIESAAKSALTLLEVIRGGEKSNAD
jgi:methyl-accepting chemotaxis protein